MNVKTTSARSTGTWLLAASLLLTACQISDATPQASTDADEPWNWSEEYVRSVVNQVRAGRDLNPESWPEVQEETSIGGS